MEKPATATIDEHFGSITDPRIERTKLHKLIDILVITFVQRFVIVTIGKILRHLAKRSKNGKRLMAGWREDYLLKALAGLPQLPI